MQAHPLSSPAARKPHPALSSLAVAEGPGLAHDAANLLGALGLYCDLLDLPGVLRPEHLHYARELRLLSQRSHALMRRLLKGGHTLAPVARPASCCPVEVLHAIAPLLRSLAQPQAGVVIDSPAPHTLPPLPFAAEVFERILVNLTRNAATAMRQQPPGRAPGVIRIALTGSATHLRLTLSDNGPGMAPATAAAFFKPKPLRPGATDGLGHRIVHELLTATGGALTITVAPGRSTTLHMDWPLTPETSNAAAEVERPC